MLIIEIEKRHNKMVDRIRWDTVSYLPFYYVFFQFLLLTIFNLQANILTTKDILSNLAHSAVHGSWGQVSNGRHCYFRRPCNTRLHHTSSFKRSETYSVNWTAVYRLSFLGLHLWYQKRQWVLQKKRTG